MSAPDVIVAGAGIVGAACALELARGGLKVAVYDSGIVSGGASAAGMGHVCVMDDSEAQFQLTRYSLELWAQLSPSLPASAAHVYCGTIWVGADEEEMAEARRKAEFYQPRGVPAEVLDPRQLAEAEPNLRPGLAGGLLLPADSLLYQPAVARWMLDEARKLGATVHTNQRIAALEDDGVHLADGGGVARRGQMVNATGAWPGRSRATRPFKPKKGHLVITERAPDFCFTSVIDSPTSNPRTPARAEAVAFNVAPPPDGTGFVGSCANLEWVGPGYRRQVFSTRCSPPSLEYMPGIANLRGIRSWTGFRAATDDALPLIGPCPGYSNVWLATGHEGLGITTATARPKPWRHRLLGTPCEIPFEP